MDSAEHHLAGFASALDIRDLPDSVVDRVGLTVADTMGTIVGGMEDPAIQGLVEQWQSTSNGGATILGGSGQRARSYEAAFVNASAGTVLELDEGHRFAAGHPAIHVLPALLAAGEYGYESRDEFVAAFVAGYEVNVRVARATNPLAEGYHPHGVWGAVGAAAAVARLRSFGLDETLAAMQIAANYAQHTRFEAATEGATVRNTFAGMSNLAALISADLAAAGFTGLEAGIERHLSSATAEGFDSAQLTADLGDRWEIERGYFKVHAACRYTHATLDAIDALVIDEPDVAPADVDSVTVETYPAAARLSNPSPENALQAKFSIPFAVATALVNGDTGRNSFTAEAITPKTLALAERVVVSVGEDIAERVPEERGARVTVTFADGTETTKSVRSPRGGEHDPFDRDELRTKFEELVAPAINEDRRSELWEAAVEPAAPRVLCTLAG